MKEDNHIFPYTPSTKKVKERYKAIFALKKPLKERPSKFIFDKVFSLIVILLTSPLFLLILIAYFLEGIGDPQNRGPIFVPYTASTCGKKFRKYKFRVAKGSLFKQKTVMKGDYRKYPSEYKKKNLSPVGKLLKDYYLDELPQIFNILKGDMSFVGPRPLAWHHYLRNLKQGNIARKILKGGLFSDSHTRKGTSDFGKPELDYGYIEKYMKFSALSLLLVDIKIITRGIKMILEGKGL